MLSMLLYVTGLISALLAGAVAATPPAPQPTLAQTYHHHAWKAGQGAPVQIQGMAQSSDGYLWLASDYGLYRFDGSHFDRIDAIGGHRLRSPHTVAVLAEADGGLWVSYRGDGVSYFKDGREIYYDKETGFPDGFAFQLLRGPDGRMWMATTRGVASLVNGRWVMSGAQDGISAAPDEVIRMLFARDGTHWLAGSAGAYYRAPGDTRFRLAWPRGVRLENLSETARGEILAGDGLNQIYRISRTPQPARPVFQGSAAWSDSAGALWLAHADNLEWLPGGVAAAPRLLMGPAQGLSGREPQAFFEDRDGNLWIATNNGLDRLRRWRVAPVPAAMRIVSSAMVAGRDGTMWLSENRLAARRFDAQGREWQRVPYSFASGLSDPDGRVTLGSRKGIWSEQTGKLLPATPEAVRQDTDISTFARDDRGIWWANFRGLDLMRRVGDQWQPARNGVAGLPPGRPRVLRTDNDGQLWLGYLHNTVARYANGAVTVFDAAHGLHLGEINFIHARRGRLWVCGADGVAWFDGQRFQPLSLAGEQPLRAVSGLVETASGELWLRSQDGLYRIDAAAVGEFIRSGKPVHAELFDADDGVGPPVSPVGPFPSVAEAGDGRLWVASNEGVGSVLPGAIRRDPHAPPVEIRAISSNGKHYVPAATLRLPEGSNNLQISFSALNLTRPERTQFRYRLRGVDRDWQPAGARREAFYTNLAPGDYTFQVIAANQDGVWNQHGATLRIELLPELWQASWFRLGGLLLLIALLIAFHRWRLAAVAARSAERNATRLEERERIARTLHDDLLQGVHALMLKCAAILARLPKNSQEERILESALDQAEQLVANTRDEVMALRASLSATQIVAELHDQLARLEPASTGRLKLNVSRKLLHLRPEVVREICQVFREAVTNAVRHAHASRIVATIAITEELADVSVLDDGIGIAPAVAAAGVSGHWGIVGMRERLARLGGVLAIAPQPDGGTAVRFTLDIRACYN
nr:two-component regulator propeller domain-containing protein [uncultured Duganella sp.]